MKIYKQLPIQLFLLCFVFCLCFFGYMIQQGRATEQDLAPNDTCEQCVTPIYGPKAQNPKTIALWAAATFVGAALFGMPKLFLLIPGALMVFSASLAVAKRRR